MSALACVCLGAGGCSEVFSSDDLIATWAALDGGMPEQVCEEVWDDIGHDWRIGRSMEFLEAAACVDDLSCTTHAVCPWSCTTEVSHGMCVIDGACVEDGAADPTNECRGCASQEIATEWSVRVGWSSVVATEASVCGVRVDGSLWCWGRWPAVGYRREAVPRRVWEEDPEELDEFGFPERNFSNEWVEVALGEGSDGSHACARKADGTVWCWGANQFGQAIPGGERAPSSPTQVGSDADWAQVAAGGATTCGRRTDGSLWCWGANHSGQLGLGDQAPRGIEPTQVGSETDWKHVGMGSSMVCGIRDDGSLWCWAYGQSDGTTTVVVTVPTRVGSASDWVTVTPGRTHVCGIREGGQLYCWGQNHEGGLGVDDTAPRSEPTLVGTAGAWTAVALGYDYTCGRRDDGSLYCWGRNAVGNLGVGDTTRRLTPERVGHRSDWSAVTAGQWHACGLRADATLACWGQASELGIAGNASDRWVPVQLPCWERGPAGF